MAQNIITICGRLICVARQVMVCRMAGSADARVFGSVMMVWQGNAVRGFRRVVSYDDITVECGIVYKCIRNTWNYLE
jgi:hypothetical protein